MKAARAFAPRGKVGPLGETGRDNTAQRAQKHPKPVSRERAFLQRAKVPESTYAPEGGTQV